MAALQREPARRPARRRWTCGACASRTTPTVDAAWEGFSLFKRRFMGTPLRHPGTFDLVIDPAGTGCATCVSGSAAHAREADRYGSTAPAHARPSTVRGRSRRRRPRRSCGILFAVSGALVHGSSPPTSTTASCLLRGWSVARWRVTRRPVARGRGRWAVLARTLLRGRPDPLSRSVGEPAHGRRSRDLRALPRRSHPARRRLGLPSGPNGPARAGVRSSARRSWHRAHLRRASGGRRASVAPSRSALLLLSDGRDTRVSAVDLMSVARAPRASSGPLSSARPPRGRLGPSPRTAGCRCRGTSGGGRATQSPSASTPRCRRWRSLTLPQSCASCLPTVRIASHPRRCRPYRPHRRGLGAGSVPAAHRVAMWQPSPIVLTLSRAGSERAAATMRTATHG